MTAERSEILARITEAATHLETHVAEIHRQWRNVPRTGDGLRSPNLDGSPQIGSHADPTATSALAPPTRHDPHADYDALMRLLPVAVKVLAHMTSLCGNLGHPLTTPACASCGRRVPRHVMRGATCPACARARQRRQQRQLDQARAVQRRSDTTTP